MNSKIVIFEDSVILYQHFISDYNWETVMAFPRGGLTYLIKNDNIKFFAYIDYFYRNCLMTMDLPIYIVDEELGIDGEYDDIEEITEILNRIFPANTDKDLTLYLKKSEAEETYQPIGDYQPSGDYFDDVEYDSSGKTIDFYSQGKLVDSIDATDFIKDGMVDTVSLIELSGDTYLHIVFNTDAGKEPIDIPLGDLFNADDYYTKDETDDLLDDKLDASAYTPVDLTDYYTKQEVDDLIPEIPSLDGYATETWVQNQGYINQIKTINNISLIGEGNIQIGEGGAIDAYTREEADERFQPKGDYVTTTTFNTYILNLTQQIESLQDAIERCCGGETGDTLYRWITLTGPNDYICSGTTKYTKEQKQQSTDNGATWTNVSPAEYRTGSAIESQSSDCGYQPTTEYRWVTVSGDYVCSGTTKYNKEKQQYRVDGGAWIDTNPLQTRRGSTVIETQSTDCGYIAPQYRWYQASASDYICSGTTKYYKEYYQVSYDGGNTWNNVTPTQTRQGSVIETQSTDCGYIAPQYRWYTSQREYLCSGTTKYQKQYYQVSYDGGSTWENVSPLQTRMGALIEIDSTDCGYAPEHYKLYITKTDNSIYIVNCNGDSEAKTSETHGVIDNTSIKEAIIGDCVDTLGNKLFSYCTSLSAVTIPSGVTTIDTGAFYNCTSLSSVTIPSSVTFIGQEAFSGCTSLKNVNIPNGIEDVKGMTFAYTNVENITIPNSINRILNHSFDNCTNLKNVTIGTGCTVISMAFTNCTGLQTVTVNATTPPMLLNNPFDNTNNTFIIKVPYSSVNTYKTASGWSTYASRIEAI